MSQSGDVALPNPILSFYLCSFFSSYLVSSLKHAVFCFRFGLTLQSKRACCVNASVSEDQDQESFLGSIEYAEVLLRTL